MTPQWIQRERRRVKRSWRTAGSIMIGFFVVLSWVFIPLYVIGLLSRFVVWSFIATKNNLTKK